jgi:hypothetical protein
MAREMDEEITVKNSSGNTLMIFPTERIFNFSEICAMDDTWEKEKITKRVEVGDLNSLLRAMRDKYLTEITEHEPTSIPYSICNTLLNIIPKEAKIYAEWEE